jgi:hypothetical protein
MNVRNSPTESTINPESSGRVGLLVVLAAGFVLTRPVKPPTG